MSLRLWATASLAVTQLASRPASAEIDSRRRLELVDPKVLLFDYRFLANRRGIGRNAASALRI